jgi:hypothetical protein
MVLTITLTANNIISNQNNLLRYSFPTTAVFDNHEIALTAVSIYYSWFNVDQALYNNNTFYYYWLKDQGNPFSLTAANPYTTISGITYYYDATADLTYTQYDVVLPDGIYELQGIVDYMQFVMIQNDTYAKIDTTNNNSYYVNMQVNPTAYTIDTTTFQVDTVAPSGTTYQFPNPPIAFTPLVKFPASFSLLIGLTTFQTNPSPSVLSSSFVLYQSNIAPQIQPNPTLLLTCDKVQNPYASPNSTVYSLASTGEIGSQIQIFVPTLVWLPLTKGSYPQMTFSWISANGGQVNIRDPNMCLVFAIRNCNTDVIQVGTMKS